MIINPNFINQKFLENHVKNIEKIIYSCPRTALIKKDLKTNQIVLEKN